jgi:hypothetical protein
MPQGEIDKLSELGLTLYGIEHTNDGLIIFPYDRLLWMMKAYLLESYA